MKSLNTFTEFSPSRSGFHCYAFGDLPPGRRADHTKGIEIYNAGRWFTVTGWKLKPAPPTVESRPAELLELYGKYFSNSRETERSDFPPGDDRETAIAACAHLAPWRIEGYEDWLRIGMALHSVDQSAAMCGEWDRLSAGSDKYRAGSCEAKWATFKAGAGGVGIGSLIEWAKQDSGGTWSPPRRERRAQVLTTSPGRTADGLSVDESTFLDLAGKPGRSDIGNARRFAAKNRSSVFYCPTWKRWHLFDGTRWAADESGAIYQLAKAEVESMWQFGFNCNDEKQGREICAWAATSSSATRVDAMERLARSEPGIPVLPAQLDSNPWLFNCPNGTVDLLTGELHPHRQADYLTKLCPTPFDPDAESYAWDRFLESLFDDGSIIDFLRRYVGYCLTGDVREHVLVIFFGDGSNGKSTLVEAILNAIGSGYAISSAPDLLMAKTGDSHPTELADLFGKRLVICSESDDGKRLNEGMVKRSTGGDTMKARRMREDFWEWKPTHKLALLTNHKPSIRGTDHGIWRRLALIPFTKTFWNPDAGESGPDELRRDTTLPQKLAAEAPGILAWAVRGCLEWQRDGLQIPDSVRAATEGYRSDQDTIGQFIESCCLTGVGRKDKSKTLHEAYENWCKESGYSPLGQKRFGESMTRKGFERFTCAGTWYRGIELRETERTHERIDYQGFGIDPD